MFVAKTILERHLYTAKHGGNAWSSAKNGRGVHLFSIDAKYKLLVGWGKKYHDLIRKNANIRVRGGKTGKKGKFFFYLGENYHFGGKRCGEKYMYCTVNDMYLVYSIYSSDMYLLFSVQYVQQ